MGFGVHKSARINIPLSSIGLTGAGAVLARDAQGQFSISLPTAATTYRLMVPGPHTIVPFRVSDASSPNLVGFRLTGFALWYSIGAVNLTSHTFDLLSENIAGNAARAAGTAVGGTITIDTDDGASAVLAVGFRTNLYKSKLTLATKLALDDDLQLVTAEWVLATGAATGTAKVHGVLALGELGFYN